MNFEKGFVQVYTGNGKGKTTAAIGQAIRAAGHGLNTCIIQFMKDFPYGEIESLKRFDDHISIFRFGNDNFVLKKENPSDSDIEISENGYDFAKQQIVNKKYQIIILDEILVAIFFKLVTIEKIIDLIKIKPTEIELILTGRYCPKEIIELADLVTDMQEVKHYYSNGILARSGIES